MEGQDAVLYSTYSVWPIKSTGLLIHARMNALAEMATTSAQFIPNWTAVGDMSGPGKAVEFDPTRV